MIKSILRALPVFSLMCLCSGIQAQNFTWMKGTGNINQTGLYGTMGTPGAGNNPGSREGAVSWVDAGGSFWMFGGYGYDFIGNNGSIGDLWKYDATTNVWTWVKGPNVATQLGTYGTLGVASSSNNPGARDGAVSWKDAAGNLWMFGGWGYGSAAGLGYLNDLWKYSVTNNQWTWVKGSNLPYQPATYGTQTISAPGNVPGARRGAYGWADASGNLWLFGGLGNTTSSMTVGYLNDLWKYNISTNEWTWMKGSSVADQNGAYGTLSVSNASNNPGSRMSAFGWVDASGAIWLQGGYGLDASITSPEYLNDLWKYNATTNEWVWLKGGNLNNQNGVYGNIGVSSPSNVPGSRSNAVTWVDAINNVWMFGGYGYDASSNLLSYLSDLWIYNTTSNEWKFMKGSGTANFPGVYGTQTTPSSNNMPGARRGGVSWIDAANNLWTFGGYGKPASGVVGALNDMWRYNNCTISPITLTIVNQYSVICAGETTSLTASGATSFTWNTGSTNPYVVITPFSNTTYIASTTNSNNCVYSTSFTQSVQPCLGITKTESENSFKLYPNPNTGSFKINTDAFANSRFELYSLFGELLMLRELDTTETGITTELPVGIYMFQLLRDEKIIERSKLVISK